LIIPRIDRLISQLESFDIERIEKRSHPCIAVMESKLKKFLTDNFGDNTIEYEQYEEIGTF
jgi:hypothetical protein